MATITPSPSSSSLLATTTTTTRALDSNSSLLKDNNNNVTFRPGDVVLTNYGVGVIVHQQSQPSAGDCRFYVRLWRPVGKSMASCAVAALQPSAVRRNDDDDYYYRLWGWYHFMLFQLTFGEKTVLYGLYRLNVFCRRLLE